MHRLGQAFPRAARLRRCGKITLTVLSPFATTMTIFRHKTALTQSSNEGIVIHDPVVYNKDLTKSHWKDKIQDFIKRIRDFFMEAFRAGYLFLVFLPPVVLCPLLWWLPSTSSGGFVDIWWQLLRDCIRSGGACTVSYEQRIDERF